MNVASCCWRLVVFVVKNAFGVLILMVMTLRESVKFLCFGNLNARNSESIKAPLKQKFSLLHSTEDVASAVLLALMKIERDNY